jgi:carbonic anhydrase
MRRTAISALTNRVVHAVLVAAFGTAFSATSLAEQGAERDWSYSGLQFPGPARWAGVKPEYGACKTGQRQSPVNIVTSSTQKSALPRIDFQYAPSTLKLLNTGHTTQVIPDKGRQISIGNDAYELLQYHFHVPSEEQIDGKSFPMGAHFVHQSATGKVVVLAVLFELGTYNPALSGLWARSPRIVGTEMSFSGVRVDISKLLPAERAYYTFEGSLNMPPCTEGVSWFVLKQPVAASAGQIREFSAQFGSNARPVQPLNGRVVRVSQ